MLKLLTMATNEAVAQNGSMLKSIICPEINFLHFQVDTAGNAADLVDLTVRVYTNNRTLVDDIAYSDLAAIWHYNQGAIGDDTDTSMAIDLGAIHLEDKEELSVYIGNANAETATIDVVAEVELGLLPKLIRYQKRQDGNFTMENVDEIWLTELRLMK